MQICPHCYKEIDLKALLKLEVMNKENWIKLKHEIENDYFEDDKGSLNLCDHCFWYKVVEEDDPPCIYCIHYGEEYPPDTYDYLEQLRTYKTKFRNKINEK